MKNEPKKFDNIEELIADIKQGKMVLLVDDEDRENEGDLVLAADHVTPQLINFMATEARGLICLALSPQQIEKLKLPLMVRDDQNFSPNKTAFTVSIEASFGVTTGISAADRAHTVRVASNPQAQPSDINMPGHIFPIRAQVGGVLKRAGHTEGSVDLATLAGCNPAAVICEVMNPDGTMARVPDLMSFAKKHGIKIGTIVDLIEYRLSRDILVEEVYSQELPNLLGGFRARVFKSKVDGQEHLLLQKGQVDPEEAVLVRVHLDSFTKDLFSWMKTGDTSLIHALEKIEQEGKGILLLLRGNNTSSGLINELKSLAGEKVSREMDQRDYGIGAQILRAVGVHKLRLLSKSVDKKVGLKAFDLEIVEYIGLKDEETNKEENQQAQSNKSSETSKTKNRSGNFSIQ